MVLSVGFQNKGITSQNRHVAFGQEEDKKSVCENHDALMVVERNKRPLTTSMKIQGDKLVKAFTEYPAKGLQGSKNANFYEFLTMGTVPYLVGSASMMAVFNLVRKFFNVADSAAAGKLGNRMCLGVAAYGILKTLSKKLIETPVRMKYGIDVNLPYKKVVNELPEDRNKDKLVTHEYHKVFESVDFPRWDLLYGNKNFGEERNAYFQKIAKNFGYDENELDYSDQKMKTKIKETVVKTRLFSTLTSYLWAAVGVGLAMQKPWENMKFLKNKNFIRDFGSNLVKSCKQMISKEPGVPNKAGRALVGLAAGMTLIGNFFTLTDFNKDKGSKIQASTSLIDDSKEKVIC